MSDISTATYPVHHLGMKELGEVVILRTARLSDQTTRRHQERMPLSLINLVNSPRNCIMVHKAKADHPDLFGEEVSTSSDHLLIIITKVYIKPLVDLHNQNVLIRIFKRN